MIFLGLIPNGLERVKKHEMGHAEFSPATGDWPIFRVNHINTSYNTKFDQISWIYEVCAHKRVLVTIKDVWMVLAGVLIIFSFYYMNYQNCSVYR